jgi:hypothetical protein
MRLLLPAVLGVRSLPGYPDYSLSVLRGSESDYELGRVSTELVQPKKQDSDNRGHSNWETFHLYFNSDNDMGKGE